MPKTRVEPSWSLDYLGDLVDRAKVSATNLIDTRVNVPSKPALQKGETRSIPVVSPAITNTYGAAQAISDLIPKKVLPNRVYNPTMDVQLKDQIERDNQRYINEGLNPNPRNAAEVVADLAPALVGGPGPFIRKLITPRNAATAVRTAPAAANGFIRAAKGVGGFLSEATLPFVQGGMKTQAAAVGFSVGLSEWLDRYIDLPEYNHIGESDINSYKKLDNKPDPNADLRSYLTSGGTSTSPSDPKELRAYLMNPGAAPRQTRPQTDSGLKGYLLGDRSATGSEFETGPAPDKWTLGETVAASAVGLGLLGLGVVGTKMVRSAVQQRVAAAGTRDLIGNTPVPQSTSLKANIQANVINANQPIIEAVKKVAPPRVAKRLEMRTELNAPTIINSATIHAGTTGQMPNSAVNIGPIFHELERATKELDEASLLTLARGAVANTALDTIAVASRGGTIPVQPLFQQYNIAELRQMASDLDANPVAKAVYDRQLEVSRKLADYLEEQGVISASTKSTWMTDHPKYTPLTRAEVYVGDSSMFGIKAKQSGNITDPNFLQHRALDTAEGVKMVADPLTDFPRHLREVIKETQHNNLRRDVLEALDGAPQYGVSRAAKVGEDTITIKKLGVEQHYKVEDKSLLEALKFNPAIADSIFHVSGRAMNKLFTTSVVGKKLNPLFPLTSAIYDNQSMRLTLSKGMHMGVLNDLLNRAGLSVGHLDPTQGSTFMIPVGSFRYLWDSGAQKLGESFADSVIQSDHILAKLFPGRAQRQNLADSFTNYYLNSNKAEATRAGVFGKHIYDSTDVQQPLHGLEDHVPELTIRGAQSALDYAPGLVQKTLAASHLENVKVNSWKLTRLLSTLQEAVRESNTYMVYSANKGRISDPLELAVSVRRMGGDMAQTGMGDTGQALEAFIPFYRAAVQPIASVARIVEQEGAKGAGRLALNLSAMLIPAITLQYMSAALDPEVQQQMRDATPAQLTNRMYLPNGLVLPSEQIIRPIWGSMIQFFNEFSGLKDGNFDPNFITAIQRWADEGMDEAAVEGMWMAARSGFTSTNPISVGNIPVANAASAALGFDLNMSMQSGSLVPIRENVGAEDAVVSRRMEKVISSFATGTIAALIQAGVDMANAMGKGVDLVTSAQVGASRLVDKSANTNGPFEHLMFKDHEKVISAFDAETSLLMKKRNNIREMQDIYNKEVRAPGATGVDPKTSQMLPTDPAWIDPQYRNTALNPIGIYTKELMSKNEDLQKLLNQDVMRDQNLQDRAKHFSTPIEERNKARNLTIDERRELTDTILYNMKLAEEKIGQAIGDPTFNYATYDKNKYAKMPYPPPIAPMPGLGLPPVP